MNRRHEAHWAMREMFEKDRVKIIPHNEQREELAAIKLVGHRKGFIAIEPKKDLKKRIGRSPDRADCIMMMAGSFDEIPVVKTEGGYRSNIILDIHGDYYFNPMTV